MAKKLNPKEAKRILGHVPGESVFWLNDGRSLGTLKDLSKVIGRMKKDVFEHHVNKEKNDFSNWIHDIIKDNKLASDLKKLKTKAGMAKKIKARVKQLEKLAKKAK